MGHLSLGRQMYYFQDQINQKEIPQDTVLLDALQKALEGRESFMICGQSFDLLHKLGFDEIDTYNLIDEFNGVERILYSREHGDIQYECIFKRVLGDVVTELYFKREAFSFKESYDDCFYKLVIKGSYFKSTLPEEGIESTQISGIKFPCKKTPSIISYDMKGNIMASCTVTKERNIWYFENINKYMNGIYKQYESDKIFDVSIVNYTHKRRIESVVFRLGNRQINLNEISDVCPELLDMKLADQVNWINFVTSEQLLVLEMKCI
jgi:hypothetical protein